LPIFAKKSKSTHDHEHDSKVDASAEAVQGLMDDLERSLFHISRHPGTGSSRYAHELNLPGLKSWPLTRYPYLVFYVERSDQ
jgi:toxin ParE1/3/4